MALEDYTKAIQLKPDYVDAYNNRGNLYKAMGQQDKALADYDKAIQLKPDLAPAIQNRDILLKAMGRKV